MSQKAHIKKPVQVTIDATSFAKVIIDVVVSHHGIPDSIVTDRGSFFPLSFGHCCAIFSALNDGYPQPSIGRQTAKPKGRTVPWKQTSGPSLVMSRMTGPDFYPWPSSHK